MVCGRAIQCSYCTADRSAGAVPGIFRQEYYRWDRQWGRESCAIWEPAAKVVAERAGRGLCAFDGAGHPGVVPGGAFHGRRRECRAGACAFGGEVAEGSLGDDVGGSLGGMM